MASTADDLQFAFFDRFTPTYNENRLAFVDRHLASLPRSSAVIDLGCGDGAMIDHLRSGHPELNYVGLDPSEAYIDRAKARLEEGADLFVGSLLDHEVVKNLGNDYAACLLVSVLHHLVGRTQRECIQNVEEAIENALSLLKPGGKLFIFEPALAPAFWSKLAFTLKRSVLRVSGNRRVEIGPGWANIGAPLVHFFTPEDLLSLVTAAGAEVEEVRLVDSTTLGGVMRRERIGIVATRP